MIRSVKFKLAALISVAVVLAGAVLVGFYYYKVTSPCSILKMRTLPYHRWTHRFGADELSTP